MQFIDSKHINRLRAVLLAVVCCTAASLAAAQGEPVAPFELPAECASIAVPAGNEVAFHAYAIGFQIYRWNGATWTFVAPSAKLYADAGYDGLIGSHFAGPRWRSRSGSEVAGARVPNTGCAPDPAAIPWLLLTGTAAEGRHGIFERVTYIQRVNTLGGTAPTSAGTTENEERFVPYAAEYYFYRPQTD